MEILFEDNHIIVINKDSNRLSQGDSSHDNSLIDDIKKYIRDTTGKKGNIYLGTVHRLDKPVSGVIIYAKRSKAAQRLTDEFKGNNNDKIYLAICDYNNSYELNKIYQLKHHILKQRGFSLALDKQKNNSKNAKLSFIIVSTSHGKALTLVKLHTGRKHQIRAQLSKINMTIIGDRQYGSNDNIGNRIALHAYKLATQHPMSKKRITFTAPIPKVFVRLFKEIDNTNNFLDRYIEKLLEK